MVSRFEVFQDRKKQWRFKLIANNGKVIIESKSYYSRRNAIYGTRSVVAYSIDAIIVDKK